jgi:hypothetical protein
LDQLNGESSKDRREKFCMDGFSSFCILLCSFNMGYGLAVLRVGLMCGSPWAHLFERLHRLSSFMKGHLLLLSQ